jgi:formate--tetrahydrofolate ligase
MIVPLREIVVGLGGASNGFPRQDGFDIVVASEVMAILCLSTSMEDLRRRLGAIVVGESMDRKKNSRRGPSSRRSDGGAAQGCLLPQSGPNPLKAIPPSSTADRLPTSHMAATRWRLPSWPWDWVRLWSTEAGFGADLGAGKIY